MADNGGPAESNQWHGKGDGLSFLQSVLFQAAELFREIK
jgi:hypothetical protein